MDKHFDVLGAGEHIEGRNFADPVVPRGEGLLEVPQEDLKIASKIENILSNVFLG